MSGKKKLPNLRELMNEDIENLIATQGPQDSVPMTDVSLDEKIDQFLVQYEKESVPVSQEYQKENKKTTLKLLMRNLFEAPETPPDPNEEEVDENPGNEEGGDISDIGDTLPGDDSSGGFDLGGGGSFGGGGSSGGGGFDAGGDDTGGGVEKSAAPVPTPKINVSSFTKNVARLVNNYQSLVNPKRIILNRAQAYLEKNYNPSIAKQMMTMLETEYNLSPESLADREIEIQSPAAAGALNPIG